MRATNVYLLSFFLLISGCKLYENIMDDGSIQIVRAGYKNWSNPPVSDSEVPETGTDLAVILKNWPEGATPSYIIYKNRKSFNASITTTSEIGKVINARIVRASSVMTQTSESVDQSDRLVYVNTDGESEFIEIEEWTRIEEPTSENEEANHGGK